MSQNKSFDSLVSDLNQISSKKPEEAAAWAFERAMEIIGVMDNQGLAVQLGKFMATHDFVTGGKGDGSQPAYHNSQHGAQVALAAAHLARAEYGDDPEALRQHGMHLVIAGLGHDLQHPGRGNQSFRELEWKSFCCVSEIMDQFRYDWEEVRGHSPVNDVAWRRMEDMYRELIVHTEFSQDAKENANAYQNEKNSPSSLTAKKILLNEADVLGSSLAATGPQLGRNFAEEEKKPFLGEWKARAGFLEFAAKPLFITAAAKKLGLSEHIQAQIDIIKRLTPEKLDALTREDPVEADNLILENLKQFKKEFLLKDKVHQVSGAILRENFAPVAIGDEPNLTNQTALARILALRKDNPPPNHAAPKKNF